MMPMLIALGGEKPCSWAENVPGSSEGAQLGPESHAPLHGCTLSPDHHLHPRNPPNEGDFLPDGQQVGDVGAGRNLGGMEGRRLDLTGGQPPPRLSCSGLCFETLLRM